MKRYAIAIAILTLSVCVSFGDVYTRPKGDSRFRDLSQARQPLPSAELDNELNTVKGFLNNTLTTGNLTEWTAYATAPTYISTTSFSVSGNVVEIFHADRAVRGRLNVSSVYSYVYSRVVSSSYNSTTGKTTVILTDAVLTSALDAISYGVISADAKSLPVMNDIVTKGPWVDVRAFPNLSSAKASSTTAGKEIWITTNQTVNNLTIPLGRRLVPRGGIVTVNSGKTLNLLDNFTAGDIQAFAGSGTVVLNSSNEYRDVWFGGTHTGGKWHSKDSYVALKGKGATNATPRFYIMPSGTGESDVTAAIKLFDTEYSLTMSPVTYKDMGFYYSKSNGAFYINSKATRTGSATVMDSAPIRISSNDTDSNTRFEYFVVKGKDTANVVTANSGNPAIIDVTSSTGLAETASAWFYFNSSAPAPYTSTWQVGTRNIGDATTRLRFAAVDASGFPGSPSYSLQKLTGAGPAIALGGPIGSAIDTLLYSTIGSYFVTDAVFMNNKILRFQNYNNTNYSAGFRANSSEDKIDILNSQGSIVAESVYGGFQTHGDILALTVGASAVTTYDVGNISFLQIPTQTGAVSVTAFTNSKAGQKLTILCSDANTTIVQGDNIKLNGSVNFVCATNATLSLIQTDSGTKWVEIGRMKP